MTAILVSANSGMVWRMRITAPAACSSSVKVGADMLGVVYGVEWGGREGVASRQVGMDGGMVDVNGVNWRSKGEVLYLSIPYVLFLLGAFTLVLGTVGSIVLWWILKHLVFYQTLQSIFLHNYVCFMQLHHGKYISFLSKITTLVACLMYCHSQ